MCDVKVYIFILHSTRRKTRLTILFYNAGYLYSAAASRFTGFTICPPPWGDNRPGCRVVFVAVVAVVVIVVVVVVVVIVVVVAAVIIVIVVLVFVVVGVVVAAFGVVVLVVVVLVAAALVVVAVGRHHTNIAGWRASLFLRWAATNRAPLH